MQRILDYLKNHGERLDSEIAAATGMSVENVRTAVSALCTVIALAGCSTFAPVLWT
mgnify:CR=1 FL=1